MLGKFSQIFKDKELRKKILFVLGILAVFRLMAAIPLVGIDREAMATLMNQNQALGLLNVFTGGSMDKVSMIMLGLGPYITATIVIQLLTMIFPALEKIYKEDGEAGKRKINQWGRIAAAPLAMLQGLAMIRIFQSQAIIGPLGTQELLVSLIALAGATVFLMWLGELITENGIGNGISILIFAGIIASVPASVGNFIDTFDITKTPYYLVFAGVSLVVITAVVLINEGRRNVPISYAKRVRGNKVYGGASTYLPMNVNPAGVIPVIFAMALMVLPKMLGGFLVRYDGIVGRIGDMMSSLVDNPLYSGIFLFFLVVAFAFFYTSVTFDPKAIADNLKKMGGFVPGIRPGESTAKFIKFILNRVQFVGAIFLGIIAILPSLIQGITGVTNFRFLIGGTALIIIVSVVLETLRQIKSHLHMRDYDRS
jgi:preprotein translocase subunit SecY